MSIDIWVNIVLFVMLIITTILLGISLESYKSDLKTLNQIIVQKNIELYQKEEALERIGKRLDVINKLLDLNQEINNHLNQHTNEQNKS